MESEDRCAVCLTPFRQATYDNAEWDEELGGWAHWNCWRKRRGLPPPWHRLAHAVEQAQARFGLTLTVEELQAQEDAISAGFGDRVCDGNGGRSFYNILVRGHECTVIFDEKRGYIITFLRPEMVVANRVVQRRKRRACRDRNRQRKQAMYDRQARRRRDSRPVVDWETEDDVA